MGVRLKKVHFLGPKGPLWGPHRPIPPNRSWLRVCFPNPSITVGRSGKVSYIMMAQVSIALRAMGPGSHSSPTSNKVNRLIFA